MERNDVLKIMLVEDDPMILMAMEAAVEDEGHDLVGTAMCSDGACKLADETAPDLVLLDYHLLDGATGIDVARHVRQAGVEVLFLSANASIVERFDEVLGFLSKPFSQSALERTLRYVAQCIKSPPPSLELPREFGFPEKSRRRLIG